MGHQEIIKFHHMAVVEDREAIRYILVHNDHLQIETFPKNFTVANMIDWHLEDWDYFPNTSTKWYSFLMCDCFETKLYEVLLRTYLLFKYTFIYI